MEESSALKLRHNGDFELERLGGNSGAGDGEILHPGGGVFAKGSVPPSSSACRDSFREEECSWFWPVT